MNGISPSLHASIAGVSIAFSSVEADIISWIRGFYREYLTGPVSCPDLRLVLSRSATLLGDEEDAEFYKGQSGVARQRDFISFPLPGQPLAFAAELSPETEDAVCNLLRWLLPPLLVRRGALLLHSAAVVRDGWGYAFFGKSGAGKSTATELIRRRDPAALAVGDDAAIIAWEEGRPWLLSAPLGCGYAHVPPPPRRVPLRGLFSLHQGQSHGLSRCPPSEGLMRLIANSMVADGSHDDGALEAALRFVDASPGVHALEFRKDGDFWDMILREGERHGKEAKPTAEAL